MALPGAEVIVDHLDDTGTAITADRSTGPQPGDPLAVPGHRSDRRDAADQEHADEEQDRAEPTAPQEPHPRHAVHDLAGDGAQVHLSPHHRPAAGRQDRPSSRRLETAGKGTTPSSGCSAAAAALPPETTRPSLGDTHFPHLAARNASLRTLRAGLLLV